MKASERSALDILWEGRLVVLVEGSDGLLGDSDDGCSIWPTRSVN